MKQAVGRHEAGQANPGRSRDDISKAKWTVAASAGYGHCFGRYVRANPTKMKAR
jgi:hypothetical protein